MGADPTAQAATKKKWAKGAATKAKEAKGRGVDPTTRTATRGEVARGIGTTNIKAEAGGGGTRTQRPPQGGASGKGQQDVHPKIKKMMAPYWGKFGGKVRFNQILEAADLSLNDLPAMKKHMKGGRNQLCWLGALGACTQQDCRFVHEKGCDLDEGLIDELVSKIDKGVCWVVETVNQLPSGPNRR
jgi:hypothetical protein